MNAQIVQKLLLGHITAHSKQNLFKNTTVIQTVLITDQYFCTFSAQYYVSSKCSFNLLTFDVRICDHVKRKKFNMISFCTDCTPDLSLLLKKCT